MISQTTQNTESESEFFSWGKFEGRVGIEPRHPEKEDYWLGWCLGAKDRYLSLQEKVDI